MLKTLLGLGGASAAAAGGLYLNNKLKEDSLNLGEERLAFAKLADDNAAKIESKMNTDEGTNTYYLPKSNDSDEYWEWVWIEEVNGGLFNNGDQRTFTEEEMNNKEKEAWEKIKRGEYISKVSEEKKEKIDSENPEYWRKYKETCLTWSSIDDSKRSSNFFFQCLGNSEAEYFENETHYKKYKEHKITNSDLSLGKFLWTMWFKFLKEGKQGSTGWGEQFDAWKSNNTKLFA